MSVFVCVCVFIPVVYVCANSPALFIMVSPVMAAKLTMCFGGVGVGGSNALLDKSAAGRRWVLSTPIHLSRDLFPGEGSSR